MTCVGTRDERNCIGRTRSFVSLSHMEAQPRVRPLEQLLLLLPGSGSRIIVVAAAAAAAAVTTIGIILLLRCSTRTK